MVRVLLCGKLLAIKTLLFLMVYGKKVDTKVTARIFIATFTYVVEIF